MNNNAQSLELSSLPHIVIATPGRLIGNLYFSKIAHLKSSDPPNFKNLKYLVLDEVIDKLIYR